MEKDALIIRKEYPQIPPKVEYSLSERGRSLIPVIDMMCRWGEENGPLASMSTTASGEASQA